MVVKRLRIILPTTPFWMQGLGLIILGGVGSLAFAPLHAVIVLVPVLTGFYWAINRASSPGSAFLFGLSFGLGHFLTGYYWIGNAFLVAGWGLLVAILAVFCLAGVSALFVGWVAWVCRYCGALGFKQILLFSALWTLAEWCRSFFVFGGFPWNLLGYVWGISDPMMQLASVVGVFGMSAVTVLCASMPALLLFLPKLGYWEISRCIGAPMLILLAIWGGGALRLDAANETMKEGIKLRLVQANIVQDEKWDLALRKTHSRNYLTLSQTALSADVTHVIWPETATPYALDRDEGARQMLASAAPQNGLLITGAIRFSDSEHVPQEIWNGLQAVTFMGEIAGSYDKRRLVPFGEYVPFRNWLPISKLVQGSRDFTAGTGPRTMDLPGLPPVGPLICFEVIFPGVIADKNRRPEWFLNVTNDAWYGHTAGPYQHLVQAQFRAVEEGLPLVRVANTGISATIDAYGRIVKFLALGERGVIDTGLPDKISKGTYYSSYGNVPVISLVSLVIGIFVFCRFRHQLCY